MLMVPQIIKSAFFTLLTIVLLLCSGNTIIWAQSSAPDESNYYEISSLQIPEDVVLEASGLVFNDDGQLVVTTRRGEVWTVNNPGSSNPTFERFGQGLHEPLGIAYRNGAYYIAQRGELTKLEDTNNDGRADVYRTIYRWPITGNYHEYSYGPVFLPDGDMLVNLNLSWIGYGASLAEWRGWMLRITEAGEMTPVATGLRSPLGFGLNSEGDIFYTENQGDWVGSGWMTHLESGDFAGNPHGLRWTDMPGSPLDLKFEDIDDSEGLTLYEQSKNIPELKNPAVWFPHTIMGISTSDFIVIENNNQVGPFEGQMLVGDQGHSKIMRVYHEKVNDEYQGAVFGFREGFSSGIIKLEWGPEDEIYVGMTNRGWGSTGRNPYGIERLIWNGEIPFEMKQINAESNGFTITFTKPVRHQQAMDINNYQITDFTYRYDSSYGSPVINREERTVTGVDVADDMLSVRIYVDGLREGYINEVTIGDIQSSDGDELLHPIGYYTLNNLPPGERSAAVEGREVSPDEESGVSESSTKKITEMPSDWANGPDRRIQLATEPGLRYDQDIITVEAGSKIAFTFENDDDMAHNVVIVEPETADDVGTAAMRLGLDAGALEYVPLVDEVLFHTSMLEPGQTETIYFEVPDTPGDYVYVCTFPGHYITMRGILRVE